MSKKNFYMGTCRDHIYINIFGLKIYKRSGLYRKLRKNIVNKIIQRIKNKGKCRVIFYVFEKAKWKTEKLYRLMEQDDRFEPIVVLGVTRKRKDFYNTLENRDRIKDLINYFKSANIKVKLGYDIKGKINISLEKYKPDVVFFQQHVGNEHINDVGLVNNYALTCYIPYFVPNYINLRYDYSEFCSFLWRYYTLSEPLKKYYKTLEYAKNNIRALGHPILDNYKIQANPNESKNYVIYAPHFSIMHPKVENKFYYSTFTQYGNYILDFAKQHPEINWVFKPHPNLIESLRKMNVPPAVIKAYYKEWESIGTVCCDSDYSKLFNESKALITDCGSFLTEYFCTGKPLIHLINTASYNMPYEAMKPMFETFYKVETRQELQEYLDKVILRNEDEKKELREITKNILGFVNQDATQNIMNDLINSFFPEK